MWSLPSGLCRSIAADDKSSGCGVAGLYAMRDGAGLPPTAVSRAPRRLQFNRDDLLDRKPLPGHLLDPHPRRTQGFRFPTYRLDAVKGGWSFSRSLQCQTPTRPGRDGFPRVARGAGSKNGAPPPAPRMV